MALNIRNMKISARIIIGFLTGGILVLLVIALNIPYTTRQVYTDVEYLAVFDNEKEIELENPGQVKKVQIANEYFVNKSGCRNYLVFPPSRCWFVIENADTADGIFKIQVIIIMRDGDSVTKKKEILIPAGEERRVEVDTENRIQGYRYYVTPPLKEVEERLDMRNSNLVSGCIQSEQNGEMVKYCKVNKIRTSKKFKITKRSFLQRMFNKSADKE
ncbi:MAG: hypothetical protein A2Y62_03820 [Candidatus Fischerbacteria bacterium RBG_13_37_8]|uniref:Uncharacterized protein n=1 Tax=Candidatus Fischerbacteria bacterium RBG_13_37_8 TaxID=1817863 RepID=A0A1F5V5T7_9BACT|nr:MAG: hypothetical protein A2Y62_03820 [Candidatus Fischerbacteria bacterium RBG_13_37_8]